MTPEPTLTGSQVDRYLRRLNLQERPSLDLDGLAALQTAHLKSVPFENLDIERGVAIELDRTALFAKVVERRRGGFCYELNALFADLLGALGFHVAILSARVRGSDGHFGPSHGHLILLVELDEPYLVDVGFGEFFTHPLRLRSGLEQTDVNGVYMVIQLEQNWALLKKIASCWETELVFSLEPRAVSDFEEACLWTQQSADSPFVRNALCTILTDDGRITLSGRRLIVSTRNERREHAVESEVERETCLSNHFGIRL